MKSLSTLIVLCLLLCKCQAVIAQNNNLAPGAPGRDAQWEGAGKIGVGTSVSLESKVWFTLLDGVMTEVYYPTVDVANVRLLQLIVVDSKGKVETERDDATHETQAIEASGLTYKQTNRAKSGLWEITKTYVTDPERATVLIDVEFKENKAGEHRLYVYYDPSLNNSGMHDSAWTQDGMLLASDADKASVLVGGYRIDNSTILDILPEKTNGYFETSDGLTQLKQHDKIDSTQVRAANGNVVQVAQVTKDNIVSPTIKNFTLALAFGKEPDEALKNAKASISKGFDVARAEYQRGWREYVKTLRKVDAKYQRQFEMAAMVLKAHEDKTFRGANIASLSVPWGGGSNANEANVGGYHLVWARDLYQVATAYMALGDKAAADRALTYLFKVQQKADGSFPQNSWLDGRPFWGSLQLDEVAFPLILAYQLGRTDNETYIKHIKPAADFILKNGAYTPQERWEEESGFSPSTIAAEIAGLVCAADTARKNNDEANAKIYEAQADDWARNIEAWTATKTGFYGDKNYYLRITENNNPNDGELRELNNGAGAMDERKIVDAGFLELVRLGVKPADDELIAKSVKVIDQVLRVETPNGASFYRYNFDGYGEMDDGRAWNFDGKYTGKGRLWALLAGERGQYELALANLYRSDTSPKSRITSGELSFSYRIKAMICLDAMLGFANQGLMIPEQIWDKPAPLLPNNFKFGEGTGSATPLAWSMAQFIRLAANLQERRNMDTPKVVYERYAKKADATTSDVDKTFDVNKRLNNAMISPLVVDNGGASGDVYFLFCDDATTRGKDVELVGDMTSWKPRGLKFERVGDSDMRFYKTSFPPDARVEYKLIVGGEMTLDKLNAKQFDNGVGENSVLEMRQYKSENLSASPKQSKIDLTLPEPKLTTLQVPSRALGGVRRVQVVELRNVDQNESLLPLPVLYIQDGSDYVQRARAVEIANSLVSIYKNPGFIIVFVDPLERMKEYWASDAFAQFLARELVPVIDKNYRTIATRDGRALLGASLGGVQSVWTYLKYPETFARVGGQSSAFWIDNERTVKALKDFDFSNPKYAARFYFDTGTIGDVLDANRRVAAMLKARGVNVTYSESNAGHNWTAWRDRLAGAFVALMEK